MVDKLFASLSIVIACYGKISTLHCFVRIGSSGMSENGDLFLAM
jgi:hypothetical protein